MSIDSFWAKPLGKWGIGPRFRKHKKIYAGLSLYDRSTIYNSGNKLQAEGLDGRLEDLTLNGSEIPATISKGLFMSKNSDRNQHKRE
jgi:hypothetical protein